jgi:phosphoglycerol transferase MdoB-like AlkP superfamily enzyme
MVGVVALLALAAPHISTGKVLYERLSDGTLVAFSRSMFSLTSSEARQSVDVEFRRLGRPRWHSAEMRFLETPSTLRRNVIVIMLESFRADTTTLAGRYDTTPFLATLAQQSLVIEDMSAVVPRTVGAWIAILGGQYPLTNEGTRAWSRQNGRNPHIRGLATALRERGYSTVFFEPTIAGFYNEDDVISALGFGEVYSEKDLRTPTTRRVNYMGLADEVMIEPILSWTQLRHTSRQPFVMAIMTNVGHHTYETPSSWTVVDYPGVTDPAFRSYLNCLSYIDSVLRRLFEGFQRLGISDNTLFVVTGDHGTPFGEHGVRMTNSLNVEGVHVPALIYAPGLISKPQQVLGPRQQIDFLPTIAELLGYRIEGASLPGVSLLSSPDPERSMFYTGIFEDSTLAMRKGKLKFFYDFGRSPTQVFDVVDDVLERSPLKSVPTNEVRAAERTMLEWQAATRLSMFARPDGSNTWKRE